MILKTGFLFEVWFSQRQIIVYSIIEGGRPIHPLYAMLSLLMGLSNDISK